MNAACFVTQHPSVEEDTRNLTIKQELEQFPRNSSLMPFAKQVDQKKSNARRTTLRRQNSKLEDRLNARKGEFSSPNVEDYEEIEIKRIQESMPQSSQGGGSILKSSDLDV